MFSEVWEASVQNDSQATPFGSQEALAKANFSLDMELERRRHSDSYYLSADEESLPGYCSTMDYTQCQDASLPLLVAEGSAGPSVAADPLPRLPPVPVTTVGQQCTCKCALHSRATCEISVGTETGPEERRPAATQTEGPATADKHVVTAVTMADLDHTAEAFRKQKAAGVELEEVLKAKKTREGAVARGAVSGCAAGGGDCFQRAQSAELSLLALQYAVCQQHCWRHYYTSARGDRPFNRTQDLPASLAAALQNLQAAYQEMRAQVEAGVPLGHLRPLSVDSQRVSAAGCRFTPAQIIDDTPVRGAIRPQQLETQGGAAREHASHRRQTGTDLQGTAQMKDPAPLVEGSTPGAAAFSGASCRLRSKEKCPGDAAACRELNMTEAWYDAEEHFMPAKPQPPPGAPSRAGAVAKVSEPVTDIAVLCVANLPGDVTKGDVKLWFEKYHVSDVTITKGGDDLRVALVCIRDPRAAEAAVEEMNGMCVRGRSLRVESMGGSAGGRLTDQFQQLATANDPPATSDHGSTTSSVKGHSFGSLMAQLTERHPEVEAHRIVDALQQLRAQHKGVLSGLPLRAIVEMTSQLLAQAADANREA